MADKFVIGAFGMLAVIVTGSAYANAYFSTIAANAISDAPARTAPSHADGAAAWRAPTGPFHAATARPDGGRVEAGDLPFLSEAVSTLMGHDYALGDDGMRAPEHIPGLWVVATDDAEAARPGGRRADQIEPEPAMTDPHSLVSRHDLENLVFTTTSSVIDVDPGTFNQGGVGRRASLDAVPLPASAPLFGGGLLVLGALGYTAKRKITAGV